MLKFLPLVVGLALPTPVRAQTPRILYISRQFWKPGHEAALNLIEAEAARMCIGLGVPHPYLGIESLTGSKEVWYINGFASNRGTGAGHRGIRQETGSAGGNESVRPAREPNSSRSPIVRDLRHTGPS